MADKKVLAVIDGKSVFYRGYYAMPNLSTRDGLSTGGVYGFATLALEIIAKLKPDYVCVAWDKSKTNTAKRKEIYSEYKANRKPAPPDFYEQVPILKDLLNSLGWPLYELDGYEADDIMGTFAKAGDKLGIKTKLISSDLDMLQLISRDTEIMTIKRGFSDIQKFNQDSFESKYGIEVEQFVDYKALMGDSSDNIPGVAGVGPKAAQALLKQFGTLDNIYSDLWKAEAKYQKKLEVGKESAFMSRELAQIMCDAPIELKKELKNMHGIPVDASGLLKKLEELEFRSLIKSLPSFLKGRGADAEALTLEGSDSVQKLDTKIEETAEPSKIKLNPKKPVYLFEVAGGKFGANPNRLYISQNIDKVWLLNFEKVDIGKKFLTELEKLLIDEDLVCYDSKRLLHFFAALGLDKLVDKPVKHDLQIAGFLLNAVSRAKDLPALANQELGLRINLEMPPEEFDAYYPEVNQVLVELYERQSHQLKDMAKLTAVLTRIDQAVVPILVEMERAGVKVDLKKVEKISKDFEDRIEELTKKIYNFADKEFNIASPKQLAEVLFVDLGLTPTGGGKKTKTGMSTAAGVLEKMTSLHPIIELVQDYRHIAKLKGTYLDPIARLVDSKDGRVHGTFNLNVAATGRLSSADPNLQNIPIRTELGREVRSIFVAEEGNILVAADYSQVELRVAAAMSGDDELVELFNDGADIHTATAAQLAGIEPEKVTSEQRQQAKAVNFGILYGQGAHGLAQSTGMTDGEARVFLHRYKSIRSKLFEMTDRFIKQAKEDGFVQTFYGRRRPMPDIRASNYNIRAGAERAALNMPIQGTSADITKLAMIKLKVELDKVSKNAKQILQVHDSIVVECPKEDAKKVTELMKKTMESIAPDLVVRLAVDTKVAEDLGSL